ncbi:hypothetical protein ABH920_007896 [Catenulispora sp. EB89]|uniref:RICIN domain-containing protein n=1 Tax=Catenulispora sp. EB89 TaxID=3156257 RepID=UPI003518FA4C
MIRQRLRLLAAGCAAFLAAGFLAGGALAAPVRADSTSITVDGTQSGRTFDGVGALSAGANSRLLFDYPEPQRSQILDYLFKPGYGASLQILKVEVGGDTNSTDGAEPSAQHTPSDADYNRGYEWWLMEQAKARNPNIKFVALAWGAPGWIGVNDPANPHPGQPYFWSRDMIDYYVHWIEHAKSDHGITIDSIGGWNERDYDKTWYENFHAALVAAGLSTKIIAADSFTWNIANDLASDPAFSAAVATVGMHYPCGYLSAYTSCSSPAAAQNLKQNLWASENGSEDLNAGPAVARAINRDYIDGKMTAYINWPPVASIYPDQTWSQTGLMLANQPWAGSYQLGSALWATAQTTQFTAPGWHYIDSASGYLSGSGTGGDPHSGSYDTLAAPNGTDYSTIFETLDAPAAQTVTMTVAGGLSTGTVHIWSSDFTTGTYLTQQADITPSGGRYTLTLQPGRVYSVTTTTGQGHGTAVGNARATMALPYSDSFDEYAAGKEARYLADQQGAFETVPCAGRSGMCVRQMATSQPIEWNSDSDPYALLGDVDWSDYTVAADVDFEQAGSAELIARVDAQGGSPAQLDGYYLVVGSDGGWSIVKNSVRNGRTTLAGGTVAASGTGGWHHLALTVRGSTITAAMDGTTLGTATDSSYSHGQIGLGAGGYQAAQFDNLSITPTGGDYGQIWNGVANANSGKLLEVPGGSASDGTNVDQWADTGAGWERWGLVGDGSGYVKVVNQNDGKVLEDPAFATAGGTILDQWADNGGANQQWQARQNADGTVMFVNRTSALVAAAAAAGTANGTPVIQWSDLGTSEQKWNLVAAPVPGRTYAVVNRGSGLDLEVPGGSTSDGTKVDQWADLGDPWERWTVRSVGGGYIELVSPNSGKVLDDTYGSTASGNQLEQWTDIGVGNEHWELVPTGDGYYTLQNQTSGLVATVSGSGDGAIVVQSGPAGAASEWSFTVS